MILPITIIVVSSATFYSLMIYTSYTNSLGFNISEIAQIMLVTYKDVPVVYNVVSFLADLFCMA